MIFSGYFCPEPLLIPEPSSRPVSSRLLPVSGRPGDFVPDELKYFITEVWHRTLTKPPKGRYWMLNLHAGMTTGFMGLCTLRSR